MGNAASAEASRKSPQKLSKSRAGSHVQTAGLSLPSGGISASSSSGTRYSSSYLAASLPPSPRDPALLARGNAMPDAYLEAHQPPPRRLSRRESERISRPPVPESPRSELSSYYAASTARGRVSRANSVVYRHSDRPLARTQSWHGHRLEKRRSLQFDMHVYGSQGLPRTSSEFLQDLGSRLDMQQLMQQPTQQATSLSSHSNQSAAPSLARTDSDLSLYVPMRRRSVIQTPGVATRPQREDLPFPLDRARARSSHPLPLADHPVFKPTVNKTARRVSLPPRPVRVESQQRSVTPCEADYRQLGGIKFGSLRITNGSPTSSPAPEKDQWQTLRPRSLSAQDSLVEGRHGRAIEIAQPNPHTNAADPIVRTSAEASGATKPPQVSTPELEFINGLMANPFSNDPSFPQFNLQLAFADATHVVGPVGNHENAAAEYSCLKLPDDDNETPVNQLDASHKSYAGVSRSDSGFGSTSSSETSRHDSSKADSGYSSNVSLRSSRSSSHIRPESDRSIHLGRQHEKRRRTLTLEKPQPSSASADGSHKHGKMYGLLVSTERRSVAMDHATWGESLDHRIRLTTTPQRRFSHRVGPSSATLNTILSVESLVSPEDSQTDSDVREAEFEQNRLPSHPLKKRRSLRVVADFAHAATSRMPSLKLRHRKSVTGKPTRSERDGQASTAASESRGAVDSIPQDRSRPVRTRASAPDLRLSISDPAPPSPTTSESSSHLMWKTPPPRVQRSRSVRDPGIPPPIPPRFRTCELLTSESPPSLPQKHSNWPWQREHGGTGQTKWHRRFMRQNLGSPEDVDGQSQSYRIPHNYNSSTQRGVPVLA